MGEKGLERRFLKERITRQCGEEEQDECLRKYPISVKPLKNFKKKSYYF